MAEGGRRPGLDPGGGGHRLRHEGRRGTHPRGRLRGLHLQADLGGPLPRHYPPADGLSQMSARILVVDDIEANVRLLEAKLAAEYYEVLTASDGPTALALAASEKPDIVLLDVMMPGMDGFAVCRRLKDDAETRHIPVVLLTALDGR